MKRGEVKTFDVSKKVKGDGSSIWGESNKTYNIHKIVLERYEDTKNEKDAFNFFGTAFVYGDNTHWSQYTDNKIAKEIQRIIKSLDKSIKMVGWSEHGMQPDNGWNFDIEFYKRNKD